MNGKSLITKITKTLILLIVYAFLIYLFDKFSLFNELKGFYIKEEYSKLFIYFAVNMVCLYALIVLLNFKNKFLTFLFYILLFFSLIIVGVYRQINPIFGLSYEDTLNIFQLINSFVAVEASGSYLNYILKYGILALLATILLFIINQKFIRKKFNLIYILFLPINILLVYGIIYVSNCNRLSYPAFQKVFALIIYTYKNRLYVGNREKVRILINQEKNNPKNIIMIADESIRGDYLSLNGFKKEITPILLKNKKQIFNYGIASSGGVCSNYSEYILLSGIQPKDLPDKKSKSRKIPTIFQYAKKAGYTTFLIDIMINKKSNRHFLMEKDFHYIDHYIDLSKICKGPVYTIDFCGINKISNILKKENNSKNFFYVVKYGAHFHFEDTYPKKFKFFKPTQKPNKWKWDIKDREKFLNSYYNSLRWNVNEYFKQIFKQLNNTDTLIIYTSDHGQNLMDNLTIKQTHCAKGPAPKEMAKVPLFLIPMNQKVHNYLKTLYRKENYNHCSHFNIFGSLLVLMGYDKSQVNKLYGKTLFDNLSKQKRIFTSGDIFGRSKMYKNKFDE